MITPAFNLTATERVLPRMALDFTTGVLDSRVTITRALNTATRVNSSGFVEIVNSNLPRFDYDPATLTPKGLLIEEARTNIALYSEQFDNALWVKTNATITADATTSPDGTTNADKLIADAVLLQHRVNFTTVSTAGTYSFSVYLKAAGYNFALLRIGTSGGWVDLTNGSVSSVTVGYTMTATLVGNGWYRVVLSGAGILNDILRINVSNAVTVTDFSGDGTSGIFLWGAQYEAGAFATSYIPTTTTSLTRNADVVSMTGTNFSSWYNASEGAFVTWFDTVALRSGGTDSYTITIANDGTTNNIINLYAYATSVFGQIKTGNVSQANVSGGGSPTNNTVIKMAIGYAVDNIAVTANAATPTTDTSATIPSVNQLGIGSRSGLTAINGHVYKLYYYPQRITNAELQAFSK